MPKFLTANELYKLFHRELPEDAYAYGKPEQYLTTASIYAKSVVLETVYSNMLRIYDNYFPQYTDEKIGSWEVKVFGELGSSLDSLEFRRDRVLTKLRSRKGIRKTDIAELVLTVIGSDKTIEIIEQISTDGAWMLGVSELGYSTILSGLSVTPTSSVSGEDLWEKTGADFGLTDEEWEQLKEEAYGYIVRIINYEATEIELAEIERLLTKYEPARSWHTIENNATLESSKLEWLVGFSELGDGTYL